VEDRNIIYNGKKSIIHRIIIKDSIDFKFTDFICDYKNAKFFASNQFVLVKSQPTQWTGLMNQYEFYQLIDTKKNICYEFFLNEYTGCR
jgi:hypothetical protein